MRFLDKIKSRWGISSNWDFLVILLVFACTGMSVVLIRKPLYQWFSLGPELPWYHYGKVLAWLFIIFPLYYVFFLCYGYLFGQKKFTHFMLNKSFGRFTKLVKKKR